MERLTLIDKRKAAENGISVGLVHARLRAGWSKEHALTKHPSTEISAFQQHYRAIREPVESAPPPEKGSKEISGKQPEITVKFTEKPSCPDTGKKAIVRIRTENNLLIKAALNAKSLRKAVKKMDEFEDWIGSISGRIANIRGAIIELESAGIQVFEKKKKEEPNR